MSAAPKKNPKPTKIETIAQALDALAKAKKVVTPEAIVAEAKRPSHPLHGFFVWDDAEAARKQRLEEAYRMIRLWKQIKTFKPTGAAGGQLRLVSVRALLPTGNKPYEMAPRAVILDEKETRKTFIKHKLAELLGWCGSIADVKELDDLRETIVKKVSALSKD